MELFHIKSSKNFLSDYLTRLTNHEEGSENTTENRFLTEKEATIILKQITIPEETAMSVSLVQKILNEESPKVNLPGNKPRKKTKFMQGNPTKNILPYPKTSKKDKRFSI